MAIAYGLIFAFSLIMPPLYFAFIRKKQDEPWLLVLFLCVCAVTLGYFLVSLSKTIKFALWANKITYLGQVFVPMCMFMIISKLCGYTYKKWVVGVLTGLAVIMYAIVFTTGWLDWYYTNATLEFENGSAYLVKEYGILHPTNLIYVVAYFVAMLVVCITSLIKKKDASQKLAGFMLAIVLGNVGMWIVGKITTWNFELLAATAVGEKSGIRLDCYTTNHILHLYTGNYVNRPLGKNNVSYGENSGFCFETQGYPDAINQPNFISTKLKAGETYKQITTFKFSNN